MTHTDLILAQARAHTNVAGVLPSNPLPTASTGLEHFDDVFDCSVARGLRQRLACHRVRFQAYCVDNHFEDPTEHADGFETDTYDEHAVHSVLTHRSTGNPIGTVRIVLPQGGGRRRLLPIETLVPSLGRGEAVPFPIETTCEVSRFAVVKSIRHHTPTQGPEADLSPEEWRTTLLCLPLALIRASIEMPAQEGMTHVVAVMEPALLRHLSRFGVHFNRLGGLVEHHGLRQPCWADITTLLSGVQAQRPDVWEFLTDHGRIWPNPLVPGESTGGALRSPSSVAASAGA
ncbi:PEP-CTERM/exosortase system-associated acyltransferase [Caenimonas koreensis]|nr:PEP-CTERM/exosortase system-associated acyltransferase [Caenimonas koreensis]